MASITQQDAYPVPSEPTTISQTTSQNEAGTNSDSSRSSAEIDGSPPRLKVLRPKILSRKSSGPIVVTADHPNIEAQDEEYDEDDARSMSPKRTSAEVARLEEGARAALQEQARILQERLLSIIEKVESVKTEHEKLESGNQFLQSYIGELMQTSKITATAGKGKGKAGKSK